MRNQSEQQTAKDIECQTSFFFFFFLFLFDGYPADTSFWLCSNSLAGNVLALWWAMEKSTLTMWTRSKITRRVTKSHLLPLVKSPASLHWRYLSVQMVWNDIKRFLMNRSCSTWRISKRRESRLSLANLMKNELAKSCAKPLDSTWQPKKDTSGFCQILILNSFKYRNKILLDVVIPNFKTIPTEFLFQGPTPIWYDIDSRVSQSNRTLEAIPCSTEQIIQVFRFIFLKESEL